MARSKITSSFRRWKRIQNWLKEKKKPLLFALTWCSRIAKISRTTILKISSWKLLQSVLASRKQLAPKAKKVAKNATQGFSQWKRSFSLPLSGSNTCSAKHWGSSQLAESCDARLMSPIALIESLELLQPGPTRSKNLWLVCANV